MFYEYQIRKLIKSYNSTVTHFWERIAGWDVLSETPLQIRFVNCKNKEIFPLTTDKKLVLEESGETS